MSRSLEIALVEPFLAGSHQRWAEELKRNSSHQIDLVTLPGRHWKWRMHGGSVTLAERLLSGKTNYDLILATDMLDVAAFSGLVRKRFSNTPLAVYFHENQLTYPWSPRDKDAKKQRDLHYAFINYTTALVADQLYFNSDYHRGSFLTELPKFLSKYPDFQNKSTIKSVEAKSKTLPLGIDLSSFDAARPKDLPTPETPTLLWNHRWEYDKNPRGFCKLLQTLADKDLDFEVALLGERFEEEPNYFAALRRKLGQRIVVYGKAETFEEYANWLWRANIIPVTSRQDFFGGSVVEAIYCDCHPILPKRLAYPDHIDPLSYPDIYYDSETEALARLERLIRSGDWRKESPLRERVIRYDWKRISPEYDEAFSGAAAT